MGQKANTIEVRPGLNYKLCKLKLVIQPSATILSSEADNTHLKGLSGLE